MKSVIIGTVVAAAIVVAVFAFADQPQCTGDRHYDGVACCPDSATTTTTTSLVDDPPTTTTTLAGCGECQPVVCTAGLTVDSTTNNNSLTVVNVGRCEQQATIPCRLHKNQKPGDVLTVRGWARCPRRGYPHWINVPVDQLGQ